MTVVRTFAALGDLGRTQDFLAYDGYALTRATGRAFTVVDAEGDGATFYGQGLTYDAEGRVVGGTLGLIVVFAASGDVVQSFGGLSLTAAGFYDYGDGLGPLLALVGLMRFGDRMVGSGVADFLAGMRGADTIRGGGGADVLFGEGGDDVLVGGSGGDRFVFARGEGHDRILDFQDGMGAQDVIALRASLYRAMEVEAVAGGVLLTFGDFGSVRVEGWDLGLVGREDFSLW